MMELTFSLEKKACAWHRRERERRRILVHLSAHPPSLQWSSRFGPLRPLLLLLVAFLAIFSSVASLDPGEVVALGQILAAYPSLSLVQQDPRLYPILNGSSKSWIPSAFPALCSAGDGYVIHGVRCVSGHVDALFLYVLIPSDRRSSTPIALHHHSKY